ncbi:MAG: TlpA family protein disulfide reductase [Actinobacteria bacterium]|nr:TlpA family protein disulfide reductase [Actinomycetota bacterium]
MTATTDQVTDERDDTAASARPLRWLWLTVAVAAAVVVTVVLAVGFGRDPSLVASPLVDEPAPGLSGATLDGGRFDLADHHGRVVLVNVWASWCPPCRDEFPVLQAAATELGPRGLVVVGIDTMDSDEAAQRFIDEFGGADFPSVVDRDGSKAVEWGVFGVPETFLVDRDGRIVRKTVGTLTDAWVTEYVEPLLAP